MKKKLIFVGIVLFLLVALWGIFVLAKARPAATALRLDGQTTELRSATNVSVVHFWATWCPPCEAELPEFVEWTKSSNARQFHVVAVAEEPDATVIASFLRERGIHLNTLFDPRSEAGDFYKIEVLPTTIIVDRRGIILAKVEGTAAWSDPQFQDALTKLAK